MRRIMSLMIGELNASHMGIVGARRPAQPPRSATWACDFDRAEYERRAG